MQLTDDDVIQIYKWYTEGMAVRDIARHFDITEPYVYNLVKGRARKDLYEIYNPQKNKNKE